MSKIEEARAKLDAVVKIEPSYKLFRNKWRHRFIVDLDPKKHDAVGNKKLERLKNFAHRKFKSQGRTSYSWSRVDERTRNARDVLSDWMRKAASENADQFKTLSRYNCYFKDLYHRTLWTQEYLFEYEFNKMEIIDLIMTTPIYKNYKELMRFEIMEDDTYKKFNGTNFKKTIEVKDRYPHGKFKYKLCFSTNKRMHSGLNEVAGYLYNLSKANDEIMLSPTLERRAKKPFEPPAQRRYYTPTPEFLYYNDPETLTVLSLMHPELIKQVVEFQTKEEFEASK